MSFLKSYPTFVWSEDEVKSKVLDLIKDSPKHETTETYRLIFSLIDLTSLNSSNTSKTIDCFIDQVNDFENHYPNHENVAALCVYPPFITQIKSKLKPETGIRIASVAASFPSSQTYLEVKKLECELALNDGADELDIVISLKCFLEKNYNQVFEEIKIIKDLCGSKHLKVILETGALRSPQLIYEASLLAMEAGADFIKTSTGKLEPAATLEAVYVMCVAINEFRKINGRFVGLKAAGGISTGEDAVKYFVLVKKLMGDSFMNRELFRFGASKLANEILGKIEGKSVNYFGEKFTKDEIAEKKIIKIVEKEKNVKSGNQSEKSSQKNEKLSQKNENTKKIQKEKEKTAKNLQKQIKLKEKQKIAAKKEKKEKGLAAKNNKIKVKKNKKK